MIVPKTHVVVALSQSRQLLGYQTLDLARSGGPLTKELAFRAAANRPALAGTAFRLSVEIANVETERPYLLMEAWPEDPRAPRLAAMNVPVSHFARFGLAMASELSMDHDALADCSVHVIVPDPSSPVVKQAALEWSDDDFDMAAGPEVGPLYLPEDFSTEPVEPRQILRHRGSFVHCVFSRRSWEDFTAAAEAETEVERAYGAPVRVHLAGGDCFVVVLDGLVELPAEAFKTGMIARGLDVLKLHRRFGGQFAAFLHLHPREVDGTAIAPHPSPQDVNVAWNLDASSSQPVVLPIALFGAQLDQSQGDIAAHAFVGGSLSEVNLELGGT